MSVDLQTGYAEGFRRGRCPRMFCGMKLRGKAASACTVLALALSATVWILTPAVSAQTLQSSNDQKSVRGTVINAVTRQPIPRALVHSADDRYATMTDSDGQFEFTPPPGTQIWLLARRPGFLGDRNNGRAIETSSGSEITIPLTPEAIIKGRVSTSTGDTLPRIGVQLLARQIRDGFARWTTAGMVQTKSDGSFRFADLASGSYKVMTHESLDRDPAIAIPGAQSFGFPPVYFPAATDFSGGATIDLTAGQTFVADLTVTDQPYYPVKIPVAGADMNGGMDVRVTLQGRSGPGYSLGYNASTQKIEGSLPNGSYTVRAFRYGPDSASGEVNLRVAGAPAEGSALTLTRSSSVTINVQEVFTQNDQEGPSFGGTTDFHQPHGPQSYLYPRLEPADDFAHWGGGAVRPQNNPNDNSIVLENVLPGRYWLRWNTGRGYVASASMGGIDLLHQPFEVASGSNIPIEITLRDDTATLQGTLSNLSSPAGTSQAWIYCVPLPDSPGQFPETSLGSSDGKFSLTGIAPGTYRVLAFASPQPDLPYRDPGAMRAYEAKGQLVQLTAGQSASVQLQIIPDE